MEAGKGMPQPLTFTCELGTVNSSCEDIFAFVLNQTPSGQKQQ
jgi:hypothetical protein